VVQDFPRILDPSIGIWKRSHARIIRELPVKFACHRWADTLQAFGKDLSPAAFSGWPSLGLSGKKEYGGGPKSTAPRPGHGLRSTREFAYQHPVMDKRRNTPARSWMEHARLSAKDSYWQVAGGHLLIAAQLSELHSAI
jgi:hypothetical protein